MIKKTILTRRITFIIVFHQIVNIIQMSNLMKIFVDHIVVLWLTASKALLQLKHCCNAPRLPVVVYDDHIWGSNKCGSERHVGVSCSSIKLLSSRGHF